MNKKLTEEIVKHVLANFAIIPSVFVNFDMTKPLISKEFVLSEQIPFSIEENKIYNNKVWGCQISVSQNNVKILLADCSQSDNLPEYALLVSLKDAPYYGLYLVNSDDFDKEALIACSLDGKAWMECQTYLQATFLAGMENIKDIGMNWSICHDYKDHYESLLVFIKFHQSLYEAKYEGKED